MKVAKNNWKFIKCNDVTMTQHNNNNKHFFETLYKFSSPIFNVGNIVEYSNHLNHWVAPNRGLSNLFAIGLLCLL